jgi:hypothetical protein
VIDAIRPLGGFLASVVLGVCALGCLGPSPELLYFDDGGSDATSPSPAIDASSDTSTPSSNPNDNGSADAGSITTSGSDDSGTMASNCLSGNACTPAACQLGMTTCNAGVMACAQTSNVTNGMPCDAGADAGGACNAGACGSCNSGADCTPTNSCQQMNVVCTSGSPVCTANGTVVDGTSCGTALFCNKGTCAPCMAGTSCVPAAPANPCDVGVVSCSQGQVVCTDQKTAAPNGKSCGTNMVCSGGSCVACMANVVCVPSANACHTGLTSCATGTQVCMDTGNAQPTGTACSDGNGCTQSDTCKAGACTGANPIACTATDACHVAGTCMSTGATTHSCSAQTLQSDGHACGTNMVCKTGNCTCSGSLSACSGTCVDTTTDLNNCGGCGNTCAGTCMSGHCTIVLASNQGQPRNLVVDSQYVYFANGAVTKVPIGGGATIALNSGTMLEANGIAIDSTNVYYADGDMDVVFQQPLGGGTATNVATGNGNMVAFGGNLYFTLPTLSAGIDTMTVPATGQAPRNLVSSGNPSALAVDSSNVYWTDFNGNTVTQTPLNGTGATTLSTAESSPDGIAVDATTVYWANDSFPCTVRSVPIGGGTPTTLLGLPSCGAVAVDNTSLYIAGNNVITKMPKGGGTAVSIASGSDPIELVLDSTYVYWTDLFGGTVNRTTK